MYEETFHDYVKVGLIFILQIQRSLFKMTVNQLKE